MSETSPKETPESTQCSHVYDELAEPPNANVPREHPLWPSMLKALKEIYDPEIPVNIYELGLIYSITMLDTGEEGIPIDVDVKMTLTSPGCPVAQEMPDWIKNALLPLDGLGDIEVEVIWTPVWSPAMMAETAKMQLNMFM